MAAPFSLEDLAKLKSFVEFVAENPTILNLPQLDFLKKFIEDLGGVVPEGTFEMPAGAKCPFGGDVKSESKATPPPASAEDDEEEIPEMEAESEESEVELDLEANNMTVLQPNILYLEEKPPKIVKTKKTITLKKSKTKHVKRLKRQKSLLRTGAKLKEGRSFKKERTKFEKCSNLTNDTHDPLYTDKFEIKSELKEHYKQDGDDDFSELVEAQLKEEFAEPSELRQSKFEQSENDDDDEYENECDDDGDEYDCNENEEDEDEPLIMLTRRKGRPRKKALLEPEDESIKMPRNVVCREICKQHCTDKFSGEQRKNICDYFWHLEMEERFAFIRKHTRARRLTRMKRVNAAKTRGNNCCYYLKNYCIGKDEFTPAVSSDLIRVCRKFFEATLCTTNNYIKKANDGSIQEIENHLLLLHEIKLAKEKGQEKAKEPKQILDPETGNLITLDAETKQSLKAKTSQDKANKKRAPRRKPGDPEPEHFPKPIKCFQSCIHKCHEKFNEEERKKICDFYWSMDYKRRKDFILANIETKDIETETTPDFRKTNRPPRAYQTRFYMRSGGMRGEKLRVCKDFFTKTLLVSRYFIKNAIEFADKTTGYYTGSDRRGIHGAPNKISEDRKQTVRDHIDSYAFWVPNKKSKTKYLHYSLSIKKMYESYREKYLDKNINLVSLHYYYKVFHAHCNILFLNNPQPKKGGGFLKTNPNISHYTGEEAGGYWIDSKGNKLDLRSINPALSLEANDITNSSFLPHPLRPSTNIDHNPSISFRTLLNQQTHLNLVRSDLNLAATFGNISAADPVNMLRML